MQALVNDLNCDPNHNYDKFTNIINHFKNKHLPTKTISFNKYKYKKSPWITNGILRSIKFRDNLYKQMKSTHPDSQQFPTLKQNLKTYNKILNRSIQQSKQNHYHSQFENFKNDTKKTWDVIKTILNVNKRKKDFPSFL